MFDLTRGVGESLGEAAPTGHDFNGPRVATLDCRTQFGLKNNAQLVHRHPFVQSIHEVLPESFTRRRSGIVDNIDMDDSDKRPTPYSSYHQSGLFECRVDL